MKLKLYFDTEDNTIVIETCDNVHISASTETGTSKISAVNEQPTYYGQLSSITNVADQLHCNRNDMIEVLIDEGILYRDARKHLQATDLGITNGWVVSYAFSRSNYTGTQPKITEDGMEYIAKLMGSATI